MKLRTLFAGAATALLLTACGGGSSPKDVTESFAKALANGECEKAMEMAVDAAKESVQGSIDAGCEAYDSDIQSTECEESGETATCKCKEKRTGMDMTFNYDLKKVDGAWKVTNYAKDLDMGDGAEG
ncbi:MAG: hypothetical protein MK078_07390 [Crocinitomicaceae bacterium]|nr:hypothetical protein [Crocinitomicaceae bacterium]